MRQYLIDTTLYDFGVFVVNCDVIHINIYIYIYIYISYMMID